MPLVHTLAVNHAGLGNRAHKCSFCRCVESGQSRQVAIRTMSTSCARGLRVPGLALGTAAASPAHFGEADLGGVPANPDWAVRPRRATLTIGRAFTPSPIAYTTARFALLTGPHREVEIPIRGIDQIELEHILKEHFTPSKEITTPDRLLGREDHLRRIKRAFNSEGRNVFIYGDRGVGKTSLAITAAQLNSFADETHIYVPCAGATFPQVMQTIGKATNPVAQRISPKPVKGGLNLSALGIGLGGNVDVSMETIIRIGIVSDGFPHFVHLIGECLFWAMHDDPDEVSSSRRDHYETAIKNALGRSEPSLRAAYQKATEKAKNRLEYEEALWALADRTETRRQLKDIYANSYRRIIDQRKLNGREPMTREKLNARLLTLRSDAHGNIVRGFGSGYYAFSENVLRGYVRLKAETEGIELIPDPA
jgi:AAA ATPase-like protein